MQTWRHNMMARSLQGLGSSWAPSGLAPNRRLYRVQTCTDSSVAVHSALEPSSAAILRPGGAAGAWFCGGGVTHSGFGMPSSPPGPTPRHQRRLGRHNRKIIRVDNTLTRRYLATQGRRIT